MPFPPERPPAVPPVPAEESAALRKELERVRAALQVLLRNVGEPGHCRGCGALIYWFVHRNGKRTPYNAEGVNHFLDCPKADHFKRPKGAIHA
jgi:hypothetical protein